MRRTLSKKPSNGAKERCDQTSESSSISTESPATTRQELGLYADMVIDHCSGADEEEVNPIDNQKHWTRFNPKGGICPRNYNHLHPSRF
jgi:alpha-amylase